MCSVKILIRLRECWANISESLLGKHFQRYIFWRCGSNSHIHRTSPLPFSQVSLFPIATFLTFILLHCSWCQCHEAAIEHLQVLQHSGDYISFPLLVKGLNITGSRFLFCNVFFVSKGNLFDVYFTICMLYIRKPALGHERSAKIQISLLVCEVWSEAWLGALWIAKDAKFHLENIGSDRPARMLRLTWVFNWRTSEGTFSHVMAYI